MKVKVFRLKMEVGLTYKVLLTAEHRICYDALRLRDRTFFYPSEIPSTALAWTIMS